MSKNTLSLSLRSKRRNRKFTNQDSKENESNLSEHGENISLIPSQSQLSEIVTSTSQLFSDTSNNSNNNSKVIHNKERGQISRYLSKKSVKADKSPKLVSSKKKKNKNLSSGSKQLSITSDTNSNERTLRSSSKKTSKTKRKDVTYSVKKENTLLSSSQQINKSGKSIKSLSYKNKNTSKIRSINNDLHSFSKESLIGNTSGEPTKEKQLIKNKRKKITQYAAERCMSDSSEDDNLFDSRLSPSTRKAKNREYALSSSNRNERSTMNKSITNIGTICKNLQRNMHLYHKNFKDQLKHKNKKLNIETSTFDMMRGTDGQTDCESLYLSDTDKKKLLSSSSSSLPELEIELKTPPRVEKIETLTSDSKSTPTNERLSDILMMYHSPPSMPQEIRDIQKDFNIEERNIECTADSDNDYNVSPIDSMVSSDLSTKRLINSWLMQGKNKMFYNQTTF